MSGNNNSSIKHGDNCFANTVASSDLTLKPKTRGSFCFEWHVNRQNCKYWATENPHTQHPQKVNVWAAVAAPAFSFRLGDTRRKNLEGGQIGIIGGSGLDDPEILSNRSEKKVTTPYGDPSDALIVGDIEGVPVAILARHGRKHDIMPSNVNYRANIWALKEEGCTHIVATNACGSLQENIPLGALVIIDDYIDWTYKRKQTFYDGEPNHPRGICHMPMNPAFCEHTRKVILETANDIGIEVIDGSTILAHEGSAYNSKAESHLFRSWGAHLIGMTTVPEVVLAKEAGLCYAAIAMSTDNDCWSDEGEKVSHKMVLTIFEQNIGKVLKLLLALVPRMAKEDWSKTIEGAQT